MKRTKATDGPGPRRWRSLRLTALVAAGLLGTLLLASGAVLLPLSQGGIGSDWLRARLEASLDQRLPADIETSIGRVVLALRPGSGLVIAAGGLDLRLPDGTTVQARSVTTTADLSALIRGEIDPRLLRIEGARIVLGPLPNAPEGQSRADQVRDAARLLAGAVDRIDRELRAAGFEDLRITDARVALAEGEPDLPLTGAFDHVVEASWMPLGPGRSKFWAEMGSDGTPWTLTFERTGSPGKPHSVDVSLADLPVPELWPALGDPSEPPYYTAPATIHARIDVDAEGGFSRLRGRASAGAGYFSASTEHDLSVVESADFVWELGAEGNDLQVRRAEVRAGETMLNLAGAVDLGSSREAVRISASLGPGRLASRPGSRPVEISSGHFIGAFDPAAATLTIDGLEVVGPEGEANVAGTLAGSGSGAGLALALSFGEMSADMARALWPPMAAPKVRRWFDKHVGDATVGPGALQIALPEIYLGPEGRGRILPDYALVGQLRFRDGSFSPFGNFPPVSGASGEISFADATATIILESGGFEMPGGRLNGEGTIMMIPELGAADPIADLTLRLTGPAAGLAELSDSNPLAIASRKGIRAEALMGSADLSLSARIPLDENADVSGLLPEFRLMLGEFASETPIAGRAISAADLVLQGNPDDYTISGVANIDGMQAAVDVKAVAGAEDSAVELTLDQEARQRLGIDLGGILDGIVMATLEEAAADGARPISLDLTASRLNLPFVGWEKGRGVPAAAEFVLRQDEETIAISDFSLSGDGFHAKGEFTLEAGSGRLRSMHLSEVSLRSGDRFAVRLDQRDGSYDVGITGRALDARGLIAGLRDESSGKDATAASLSIDLEQVTALNGVVLREVRGTARIAGGQLRRVAIKGKTPARQSFDWTVTEKNGSRRMLLRTADGGAILGGLGLYARIAGGDLALDMVGPAGSPSSNGLFTLSGFRIIDEDALATAVAPAASRASGRNSLRQVRQAEIDTRNMQFSTLQVPFRRQGDVVTIDEAFLRGALLGGTGSGTINLGDRTIAISGSLIPIFGINNIAGAIPILGEILGGGRNEGLVGITYRLAGPLDSPSLNMNPLSAIAPGIFRRIFEYR